MSTHITGLKHITFRVTDTKRSKEFYADKLGLTLLDEKPDFFAIKAGSIRISFFGGHKASTQTSDEFVGANIVLSTNDIQQTRDALLEKGIVIKQDIVNANNFLKFIVLSDPDDLIVEIAEYLVKDTLESKL
jgi:catechol 2,3-dioxygenase-like lactoylglutathione lyase family enzyme